jgi:hypothetical protein
MAFKDLAVGFTGTRQGMSSAQRDIVVRFVAKYKPRIISGRHGDCVGSDREFHDIMRFLTEVALIGHPPTNPKYRAWCKFDILKEEKNYHVRDKDIVDNSNVMLATPAQPYEILRSGTWTTIRYAKKKLPKERILIIPPDGAFTIPEL